MNGSEHGVGAQARAVYEHFREVFGGRRRRRVRRVRSRGDSEPYEPGRDPNALGRVLDTLTEDLGWTSPLARSELVDSWSQIVGDDLAAHCEPVSIDEGVLYVRCGSTAWATQLRLMRSAVTARIAERYPEAGVESIRFQGPEAPNWKRGFRAIPGRGPRDTYG